MIDPAIIEALYRGLRAVAMVTGLLVAVDSIGVLLKPRETPPHSPKWNASAWLVASLSVSAVAGVLTVGKYPTNNLYAPIFLYVGLIVGFTVRAISRAERWWLTVISASCMSVMAVWIAWWDVAG